MIRYGSRQEERPGEDRGKQEAAEPPSGRAPLHHDSSITAPVSRGRGAAPRRAPKSP